MSEKEKNTPLKEFLSKENPSTLLKFILAALGLLASIGTGILYIPSIDIQCRLFIALPFYLVFFFLLISTYFDAKKDPFRYIANSNTFIALLRSGLGDSYKKTFYSAYKDTEPYSNAPIEIDEKSGFELIKPVKTKDITKKLAPKK